MSLPKDVDQFERVTMTITLPPVAEPGRYRVEFDIVLEGVMWFADRASPTASIALVVR